MGSQDPVVVFGNEADIDTAIQSIEKIIARLENTPDTDVKAELDAAEEASLEIVNKTLPVEEQESWHSAARQAIEKSCIDGESCQNSGALGAAPLSSLSTDGPTCAFNVDGCGGQLGKEQTKKSCVHDCGVGYCSVQCWKSERKTHEADCQVLYRRRTLQKLGLGGVLTADELF